MSATLNPVSQSESKDSMTVSTHQTRVLPAGLPRLTIPQLQKLSAKLRIEILDMIYEPQSGHPGSSLSCIDLLVTLWFHHMVWDPANADWTVRDRFIMSKGHGAPAYYATLMEAGYIPWDEKKTLRQINTNLQGHPASKYIKGCDISTGSLGQGLSCGVGMALGLRLDKINSRVMVLMGDGECQEGNVWEAVLSAAHHKVSNLTAIVDRNHLQIDGDTEKVKALGAMAPKFAAFDWNVIEIDGHDFAQIQDALAQADRFAVETDRPTVIIANTIKGKGVSFMENQAGWHGKAPNKEQYEAARGELVAAYQALS
ncbi:transketolase [Vampirovibrio sp.]|uniref:transketolase n=1 Tax=Vampirovibrio sp. TaxID=2717857 RepID=UPI00359441F1